MRRRFTRKEELGTRATLLPLVKMGRDIQRLATRHIEAIAPFLSLLVPSCSKAGERWSTGSGTGVKSENLDEARSWEPACSEASQLLATSWVEAPPWTRADRRVHSPNVLNGVAFASAQGTRSTALVDGKLVGATGMVSLASLPLM